ncbi:cobalamin synthase [Defluviimonas sp. 20V17]|uniref:Adenosylcobinamide-GDP ribazoletransferase n=1 Tax=Allgaiera indica TaxID=765699 RepID=A0AAN4URT6_9RHOB|nr:adenosylcobinamide-GDP ribazoletransferase [Allgaiera indica]KDB02338.1 cobalamin synthase [Defluviimonas sp. 20V17]GHE02144.1 adenosylcobinamide-GDP ribazoletransferase [Allgaiera indica]SDX05617.1 cobalamin-5'-phosphate synthase [Allgaiera indica]
MTGGSPWSRRRWAELRLALALLTRLPVGRLDPAPPLSAAAWAYPLAGVAVGAIVGLVFWIAQALGLAPLVAAILAVAAGVLATGAMHEDGLADLADGFGGGADPARKLEIMRDSRLGSYGAIALGLALLLRVALLSEVLPGAHPVALAAGVAALSRAPLPVIMRVMPSARNVGLGRSAADRIGAGQVWACVALALAIAVVTLPFVIAPVLAAALGAALIALIARRQIAGFTGDVLGAAQVTAELCIWLALSAA